MNAYKIALVVLLALSVLVSVAAIGKPRKPITPGVAVWVLIVNGVVAFLVIKA